MCGMANKEKEIGKKERKLQLVKSIPRLLLLLIKKYLMKVKEESKKAGLKLNIQKN